MASGEFGQAVRRWRDRASPDAAGLPAGGRRRAAGLRREELALLAGISVDYITRLEQGRASSPSAQVTDALARALRLSPQEREHLFRLAGLAPPGPDMVPSFVTPSVHRLLDRLAGVPVAVYDASWTLLLANPPYAALMGDPSGWRGNERNGGVAQLRDPGGQPRAAELAGAGGIRGRAQDHRPPGGRPADAGL
jgi:transcriptional regulator with XRE-family HTH domain